YITRALGPDEYAKFVQMQFLFSTFITVFSLSIPSAVSRYSAEHAAKGEMQRASGVLKTGFKTTIVMGMVASAAMFLFSDQLAGTVIGGSESAGLVKLLAVSAGLSVAISPLSSYIYALQKFREYTLISVVNFAFWRASLVTALILGTGLYGLGFAWMVMSIASSIFLTISILRMAGKAESYPLAKLFSYSMPLVASTYIGFFSQWIDSLLLPYVGSMRMLSMANIAGTLANITLVLINSASTILFTHFVRVDTVDGRDSMLETGQRISRLLSYVFVPLGFFVGAISDLLVLLYAGGDFMQAALFLRVLSPFMTTGAVFSIIWTNEVTAAGKTRILLLNTIVTLASYSILGIFLVPWLGEVGYLLTRILCSIVAFPYVWIKTKAIISVKFDFVSLLLSILISMVIIVPATLFTIITSNYLLTLIISILGVAFYALILISFGLITKDEIRVILRLFIQSLKFQVEAKNHHSNENATFKLPIQIDP
ncbi:MAG: oligosaccharide flippase family protein, partial [Candidatus Bathyarchaeia archaeon]